MMALSMRNLILAMRMFFFVALFAGPLGAMTIHQERGLGVNANAAGLVLLTSIKRG